MASASQRDYIIRGVEADLRTDGRQRLDYRALVLETGIFVQASGSARLRLGGTEVLVGIKAEIGNTEPGNENEGRIQCSVDCAPSASRIMEDRAAEELENELAQLLNRVLCTSGAVDLRSLCLIPGKECWVLYIDALVLDYDGNLTDAVVLAARAALHSTRIPAVSVIDAGEGQMDIDVSDDPDDFTRIPSDRIPVCVTLSLIGDHIVADAAPHEEECAHFSLALAFKQGALCLMHKSGPGAALPTQVKDMIQTGKRIALALTKKLDAALSLEEKAAHTEKIGFFAA